MLVRVFFTRKPPTELISAESQHRRGLQLQPDLPLPPTQICDRAIKKAVNAEVTGSLEAGDSPPIGHPCRLPC